MAKESLDDTLELLNLDDTMELLNLEEKTDSGYYLDDTEEEDDYFEAEVRTGKGYVKNTAEESSDAGNGFVCRMKDGNRKDISVMDKVLTVSGSLILVLALILGGVYINAQAAQQTSEIARVSRQMDGIAVIGESGLLTMANAQNTKVPEEAAEEKFTEETEYEEKELYAKGSIEVEMHISSMEKDLKIKFINKKTGKRIQNVAFEVDVTTADAKTCMLADEDMDGIIYQTQTAPGKCTVAMRQAPQAPEYAISTEAVSVTVKDKIEYKKVDVTDEVKTEAEVNAAVEDTKRKNETESEIVNTVDWVESSKNPAEKSSQGEAGQDKQQPQEPEENGGYEEVPKDNIPDPAASSSVTGVCEPVELSAEPFDDAATSQGIMIIISQTAAQVSAGKTIQIGAAVTGAEDKTMTWCSDHEEIAVVAQDGTITGISLGTASIEAICNADSNVKAVCQVTVTDTPDKDRQTELKDNNGNRLYIKDSEGNFKEAVYADYYTADKFYKKTQTTDAGADVDTTKAADGDNTGEYKYTGWQTIDGKTYYFDGNGNKVTGEQVIQGVRYTFDGEGVLCTAAGNMGIDVSKWNGAIDWNAVKNSGVSYVIIRCGYRGSTTGALIEDPSFRTNIQGASAAGLKVGIYFFTQAVNEVEAVEEASMVAGLISGYHISYPVFLDVEPSGGRADALSREARTAVCRAFCQTIQNSGYTAGIYANHTWLREKLDAASLADYKIWLAQYAAEPTYNATRYDLWQYSAKGKIAGISTETDLNISYLE